MIIAKATNSTAKIFTKAMPILSGLIIAIKNVLKCGEPGMIWEPGSLIIGMLIL